MGDVKISNNFFLSEFGGVAPETALLKILQEIRDYLNSPIIITDSIRSISEHVQIYKRLERENKIKTLGNRLGTLSLFEYIPWKSRHLPAWHTNKLRAVDITCVRDNGIQYTGAELYSILNTVGSGEDGCALVPLGIGVGKTFLHIDVDRKRHAYWEYDY